MQTTVFYFSGTGNSFATAKRIAKETNGTLTAITAELLESGVAASGRIVVVYPSYAYGMPSMMYRFFREADFNAEYLALIVTYGSVYGATLAHGVKILKRRGIKAHYAKGVKCVENYIPIFGLPRDEKIKLSLARQRHETEKCTAEIISATENDIRLFRPFSRLISKIFRTAAPLLAKFYRFTNRCTNCGICGRVCPNRAIIDTPKNKPKVKGRKCQHCQACLNWCPVKAISYVRMNKNSRRYHHPEVTLQEMLKRD